MINVRNIVRFLVKQITRLQYGATRLNFIFAFSNFISLLLLLLTQVGVELRITWVAVIYASLFVGGLLLIYVIELLGGWQVEKRQAYNMSQSELWLDKQEYVSLKIAEAMNLSEEERERRLSKIKERMK